MTTATMDPETLASAVLWSSFACAMVFGALAQKTNFCTMGAIADIVSMGDWTRMRMWVLAIAVAVAGFNAMVGWGWIEAGHSLYGGPRLIWLSALLGGTMFGFGMVLASGCGSKNLVRLGGGNLKSLVVLIVLGIGAFATLKGITAVARVASVERAAIEMPHGQDLPALLARATGIGARPLAWLLGAAISIALVAWVLRRPEGRRGEAWLGGAGVGAVIVALWWISG